MPTDGPGGAAAKLVTEFLTYRTAKVDLKKIFRSGGRTDGRPSDGRPTAVGRSDGRRMAVGRPSDGRRSVGKNFGRSDGRKKIGRTEIFRSVGRTENFRPGGKISGRLCIRETQLKKEREREKKNGGGRANTQNRRYNYLEV